MNETAELATSPDMAWQQITGPGTETVYQSPPGPKFTNSGDPVRYRIVDHNGNIPVVDGVEIRVILEPDGEGVVF